MRTDCRESERPDIWGAFENRVLRFALEDEKPMPCAEMVEKYDLESPAKAANLLITATREFSKHLRAVIREYAGDDAAVDEEIVDLMKILAAARRDG